MLTIVVDSFDGYSDLWPSFFEIFKKNWPDCPYQLKLVSNHKVHSNIDTICTGDETCWSERTYKALKQIDTEYVLLLLEDYFLGELVKNDSITEIIEYMKQNNADYFRLTNIPTSRFSNGEKFFNLYADEEYAINLQASIWRTTFLLESLKKYPGNAWEFEIGFLKEAVKANHKPLINCFGVSIDPLHIHNGVLKGKWFPKEIKYFSKQGIDIQWQERGKLSFWQNTKYHIAFNLKEKMSYKMRKRVKSVLKKIGVKFVSDL